MFSTSKIKNEISRANGHLFKSLFPNKNYNFNFRKIKKFRKFKTVVLIGMGGSILGPKAIYSFLKHKIKKEFIFIDNLDHNFLKEINNKIKISRSLFVIISKSGNTTETIVNSSFFKTYFKKSNVIIISENKNNILANFAKKKNFEFIKHNHYIGGRYSVFSEVGMVPAYLMGLDPFKFKQNLTKILQDKKKLSNSKKNVARIFSKKKNIIIFFNYIPELHDFLLWSQQLLAESLGKNRKGFIPVISNAPKDHHSLLQLYLDGPKDKFFYVFSSYGKKSFKVNCNIFGDKTKYFNKKYYEMIKISQKEAFLKVLKKNNTPFREIKIKKFDEKSLGELFLLFIFETIIFGKKMKINPFDQPAVESVKILTKKFLNLRNSTKKNF